MQVSEESKSTQSTSNGTNSSKTSHFPVGGNPGIWSENRVEDKNCLEGQIHPLLNDVILRNFLDHVRREDLLACRGVCQQWNVATIPYTRLAFEIHVYGNQTIQLAWGIPREKLSTKGNTHKVENFVELFSSNNFGIPFGKFKLGAFSTTEGAGQKFLELCGDTVREISFFHEIHYVENLCEFFKSTPKLQSLQYPRRTSSQLENNVKLFSDGIPVLNHLKKILISVSYRTTRRCFLQEILDVAPNISDFTIYDEYSENPEENSTSLKVLRQIEKLGRGSSIQTLILECMRSEHVKILTAQSNKFKLRKLIYSRYGPGVDPVKLITFFKNTLHDLKINDMTTSYFMGFPKMPQLKRITLWYNVILDSRCVNLEKIFPALETLNLNGKANEEHDHFFPDSKPCLTLKSLVLRRLYLKINGFKHVQIIFPNLTKLDMKFYLDGPETLRQIWGQMTQLEELTLHGRITTEDDLDALFTGISNQGIQEITRTGVVKELEEMTEEGVRRETIRSLKNQYSQLPSITNLKKLRSVSLNVWGRKRPDHNDEYVRRLTDLTLYLGLYGMENLKQVVIEHCGFTVTGCIILRDEMELESWSFKKREHECIPLYTFHGSVHLASNVEAMVHEDII